VWHVWGCAAAECVLIVWHSGAAECWHRGAGCGFCYAVVVCCGPNILPAWLQVKKRSRSASVSASKRTKAVDAPPAAVVKVEDTSDAARGPNPEYAALVAMAQALGGQLQVSLLVWGQPVGGG
jgi:hypothetical protein